MRCIEADIEKDKLIEYGFKKKNNEYIYSKKTNYNEFNVEIIYKDSKLISKIIDLETNYEYTLVDNLKSTGAFVNSIREEYDSILNEIKKTFSHSQKLDDIKKYIKKQFDTELEYLWDKFPDVAIWRNKENNKWFGIIMNIQKNKLGIDSDETIETITLKYQKDQIDKIVDNNKIFKGYHMNKRSWITINIDSDIELKEIIDLIDNSYELSKKRS